MPIFFFKNRRNNKYSKGQFSQELNYCNSFSTSLIDNVENNFNYKTQPTIENYNNRNSPKVNKSFDYFTGKINSKEVNKMNNLNYGELDSSTKLYSSSYSIGRKVNFFVDKKSYQNSEENSYEKVSNRDDIEMKDCHSAPPFNCFIPDTSTNLSNIDFFNESFDFGLRNNQNDEMPFGRRIKIKNPFQLKKLAKLIIPY